MAYAPPPWHWPNHLGYDPYRPSYESTYYTITTTYTQPLSPIPDEATIRRIVREEMAQAPFKVDVPDTAPET